MCCTLLPKSAESNQVLLHVLKKHYQEPFSFSISHTAWLQKEKLFPCASPCPVLRVVIRSKSKILPVKNHTVGTEESRTNGRVRGTDRSPEITLPALYGTKNLLDLICCPSASAALPAWWEGPTCHEKQHRQHACPQHVVCNKEVLSQQLHLYLLQLWKTKIFAFLDD